jgi:hypothetical protein
MLVAVLVYGTNAPVLASPGGLLLGLYMVYVGWFGQGNNRTSFGDDLELHQQNKKRYKWRL